MTEPGVAIVVPVREDPRIEQCLDAIARLDSPAPTETVVVANGSTPGFTAWLETITGGEARLVVLDAPGAYAARNAGIAATTGSAIFLTDADCQVEPGWIAAGLAAFERGVDVVQGFSGTVGSDRSSLLVQRRYEAHLHRVAPGQPTECDTRNMAFRRAVFERVRFREEFRRTSDTEFGLACEAAGFRVAYDPAMRVLHSHEGGAGLLLAKQVCHGWGSRRIMASRPDWQWHSANLRRASRAGRVIGRVPSVVGRVAARTAVAGGRAVDALDRDWLPLPAVSGIVALLELVAAVGGQAMYRPGSEEPLLSRVAGRRLPRD